MLCCACFRHSKACLINEEYSHSTLCLCLCPSPNDKYIEERAYAFFLFFLRFYFFFDVDHLKVFRWICYNILFWRNCCLFIFGHSGLCGCPQAFSSCSAWAFHCHGFSCCRAQALGHGLSSYPEACGIFLDQRSNPHPPHWHWQADS